MSILIWLLTFILVLDCLLLILLVLIQLPKKEAGLGQAFGGGATDALFGAGSGTALTNLTKYTAGIFFALTLLISMLHGHQARAKALDPRTSLTAADKEGDRPPVKLTAPPTGTVANVPAAAAGTNAPSTNATTLSTNTTNSVKPATNAAVPVPK
jgi:preprotein translocase subunit SecG